MPALSQAAAELWNNVFNAVLVLGAIGALVGTWGTFWTGNMKETYTNQRVSANEAQTATANAEAGRANEAAAKAHERAANLEKEAAEARLKQAEIERSNLELRRQIEDTQKATTRIEGELAPRTLTIDQRKLLIDKISASGRPISVAMTISGQPEAQSFGRQVLDAFKEAGVSVQLRQVGGSINFGVPSDQDPAYGIHHSSGCDPTIIEALEVAGIASTQSNFISPPTHLVIGEKR